MVWEEKRESKRIGGVEDDKVMRDLDDWATRHISHDRACTRIEVTQLLVVCGQSDRP